MSDSIAELASALAKAQGVMKGALKDSTNPHFRSSYADLASVWDAAREALTSNGLSVVQMPGRIDTGMMTLTTCLLHESGQWMREALTIPLSKVDAQGYGSAASYARRYALAAFVGVAPEDDDGNAASGPASAPPPRSTIATRAIEALSAVADREALEAYWTQQKDGLRGALTDADYAAVVVAMRAAADRVKTQAGEPEEAA